MLFLDDFRNLSMFYFLCKRITCMAINIHHFVSHDFTNFLVLVI